MLAAVIKKDGRYSVEVKNYSASTLGEVMWDLPKARIYGITTTSMEIPAANEFASDIKEMYPAAKVVVGGPGTITPEYYDRDFVDVVVTGEAEFMILNVMRDLSHGVHKGIYKSDPPSNLDKLPFPAREMLDGTIGGDVFAYNKNYIGEGSTAVLSSRGCPSRCAFCASPNGVRYRSVYSVVAEMENVMADYGIRQFRFSDDQFASDATRVRKLCDQIGPLGVAWRISARVKPLSRDTLVIMKEAGCKEISFGCESFDNDVLNLLNKGATTQDNVDALILAGEVGINARILLMIGTPGQTVYTPHINMTFIDRLPHKIVACTAFVPMPGTDVWYNPDKYGIEILSKDMRDYNFYFFGSDGVNDLKPVIKLKDRPLDEFIEETNEFRQWLLEREDVNRG